MNIDDLLVGCEKEKTRLLTTIYANLLSDIAVRTKYDKKASLDSLDNFIKMGEFDNINVIQQNSYSKNFSKDGIHIIEILGLEDPFRVMLKKYSNNITQKSFNNICENQEFSYMNSMCHTPIILESIFEVKWVFDRFIDEKQEGWRNNISNYEEMIKDYFSWSQGVNNPNKNVAIKDFKTEGLLDYITKRNLDSVFFYDIFGIEFKNSSKTQLIHADLHFKNILKDEDLYQFIDYESLKNGEIELDLSKMLVPSNFSIKEQHEILKPWTCIYDKKRLAMWNIVRLILDIDKIQNLKAKKVDIDKKAGYYLYHAMQWAEEYFNGSAGIIEKYVKYKYDVDKIKTGKIEPTLFDIAKEFNCLTGFVENEHDTVLKRTKINGKIQGVSNAFLSYFDTGTVNRQLMGGYYRDLKEQLYFVIQAFKKGNFALGIADFVANMAIRDLDTFSHEYTNEFKASLGESFSDNYMDAEKLIDYSEKEKKTIGSNFYRKKLENLFDKQIDKVNDQQDRQKNYKNYKKSSHCVEYWESFRKNLELL